MSSMAKSPPEGHAVQLHVLEERPTGELDRGGRSAASLDAGPLHGRVVPEAHQLIAVL